MKLNVNNTIFVITGAAMGMGKLYAERAVAEHAAHIVLWDINETALRKTVSELQEKAHIETKIHGIPVDVSDIKEVDKAVKHSIELAGIPDVLINNAGVVRSGKFWDNDPIRDINFVMEININAPLHITRAFLPFMMQDTERPRRIMNIASAAGLLAQPGMSVYAASKWAVIGWSDSLRLELQASPHKNILVTTICPSFVNTGMFDGAKPPMLTPLLDMHVLVNAAWKAMLKGSPIIILPKFVVVARALRGLFPARIFDFIAHHLGAYHTMEDFIGHNTGTAQVTSTTLSSVKDKI